MSLCIGFGCGVALTPGRLTCPEHAGLEPSAPDCPDGHGVLAFVIVSGVELGGLLHLMYACLSCDYVTVVDYPPTTVAPGVADRGRRRRVLGEYAAQVGHYLDPDPSQ